MHRIDADGNLTGLFTDGNPVIPQVATEVDAAWLNDLQENVCQAIEAASLTLIKGTYTQLTAAIQALAAAQTHSSTVDWTSGVTGTAATISRKGSGFVAFQITVSMTDNTHGVSAAIGTIHDATCRPPSTWSCEGTLHAAGGAWSSIPMIINADGTFASNAALSTADAIFLNVVFPGA